MALFYSPCKAIMYALCALKLSSQFCAAFAAAGSKNFAAVDAFAAGKKAVFCSAVTFFGLESSFHDNPPEFCTNHHILWQPYRSFTRLAQPDWGQPCNVRL